MNLCIFTEVVLHTKNLKWYSVCALHYNCCYIALLHCLDWNSTHTNKIRTILTLCRNIYNVKTIKINFNYTSAIHSYENNYDFIASNNADHFVVWSAIPCQNQVFVFCFFSFKWLCARHFVCLSVNIRSILNGMRYKSLVA